MKQESTESPPQTFDLHPDGVSNPIQCPDCKGAGGFYSLHWDGKLQCSRCWGSGTVEASDGP